MPVNKIESRDLIRGNQRVDSWDLYAFVLTAIFLMLQILRWRILPQFVDIHYHLLTAWGFVKAGGFTGWDFWQYAPYGRPHIYPPLIHLVLAFLLKLGINKIILAKLVETIAPVLFFFVLWYFVRKNFGSRLAFFVLFCATLSQAFYLNLINHIPSTLAFVLGILAIDRFLHKKPLGAVILLALCFYTHIGVSWFMGISLVILGLLDKGSRRLALIVFAGAFGLAAPVIFKQIHGLSQISTVGLGLNERFFCQFKIFEYLLALYALFSFRKLENHHPVFLCFLLASFIFVIYPYRFFSAEGYFPIIFLSALGLQRLHGLYFEKRKRFSGNLSVFALILCLYLLSTTIILGRPFESGRLKGSEFKVAFAHTALKEMVLPLSQDDYFVHSLWFERDYLQGADIIRANSRDIDIIYSPMYLVSVCFGAVSERACANGLFPEIKPSVNSDPFLVSRVLIFGRDEDPNLLQEIIDKYRLEKIGQTKLFVFFKNPSCSAEIIVKKASVSFSAILTITALGIIFLYVFGRNRL